MRQTSIAASRSAHFRPSALKARELARKVKGEVATRIDPVGADKAARKEARLARLNTLDGLAAEYWEDAARGLHRASGRAKRDSTIAMQKYAYNRLVKPTLGDMPVASITRRDILDLVSRTSRKAKSNGHYIKAVLGGLLAYAEREVITVSPVRNIPVVGIKAGTRLLSDAEIRAIWNAAGKERYASTRLCLRMMAVTLQRGGEVGGMRWSEIDRESKTWTIPAERMKNGRVHVVPLSDMALELLDASEAEIGREIFVFPNIRHDDEPVRRVGMTQAFQRIVTDLKMPRATPHDLRRTGTTNLTSERVGVPRFIVSQVLSHSSDTGGAAVVTGAHYDLHGYVSEKRRALDAWARLLTDHHRDPDCERGASGGLRPVWTGFRLGSILGSVAASHRWITDMTELQRPSPDHHAKGTAAIGGSAVSTLAVRGLLEPHQVRAAVRLGHLSAAMSDLHSASFDRPLDRNWTGHRTPGDSGLAAAMQLTEVKTLLGERNYAIAIAVCAHGLTLRDLGKTRRERDFVVDTLRACLDDCATRWGYAARNRGYR